MDFGTFRILRARRPDLRQSWERLLRIERTTSPLADPNALVHLLDTTLDEVFRGLARRVPLPDRPPHRGFTPDCPCGLNPFLAYYAAGRQALREALVTVQAATPHLAAEIRDQDLQVLNEVFDRIARRDITAFCGICQFRRAPHGPLKQLAPCGAAVLPAHVSRSR